MFIKRICFPVTTLGPGDRVAIWMTGCEKNCKGCLSKELRDMRAGDNIPVDSILAMIAAIKDSIDGFTISGGEPFLQEKELACMVKSLAENYTEDIIVYSGLTLNELRAKRSKAVETVLDTVSVLIDGEYIEALNDGIGLRGSSNQRVHIFKNNDRFEKLGQTERQIQGFQYDGKILLIGIPK